MLSHIQSLGAPTSFIASIQNRYDLNGVKCSLIISAPGTHGGPKTNPGSGNQYGLLRLNALVQSNGFTSKPDNLILNSCTGTTGNLDEGFMRTVHQAACGNLTLQETDLTKDMVVIVYPTRQDVEASIEGREVHVFPIVCSSTLISMIARLRARLYTSRGLERRDHGCHQGHVPSL